MHEAIRERRAKLEHIQGMPAGMGTVQKFDLAAFAEKVTPILADWGARLQKNKATAAQVLRKLIPTRLTIAPTESGGWRVKGDVNYSAVLKECGFDAVEAVITEVAKLKVSRVRRAARTEPRTE